MTREIVIREFTLALDLFSVGCARIFLTKYICVEAGCGHAKSGMLLSKAARKISIVYNC